VSRLTTQTVYKFEADINRNDCNPRNNVDPAKAGVRMKSLIDDIYSKLPDVTIVLSTLVKSRDYRTCAEDVSRQFRNLVKNEYRGKRMGLADIDSVFQMSQLNSGGIHPTDDGYKLFAGVWWNAISKLEGVIQPPPTDGLIKDDSSTGGANTCKKVAGTAGNPVKTQNGSGHDDGDYKHDRVERGIIESGRIEHAGDPDTVTRGIPLFMYFADIIKNDPNSDRSLSLDDWIRVRIDSNQKCGTGFVRILEEASLENRSASILGWIARMIPSLLGQTSTVMVSTTSFASKQVPRSRFRSTEVVALPSLSPLGWSFL
jgi:hypothetical protein